MKKNKQLIAMLLSLFLTGGILSTPVMAYGQDSVVGMTQQTSSMYLSQEEMNGYLKDSLKSFYSSNRSSVAVALYVLAGKPATDGSIMFTDIRGKLNAAAAEWAVENGIMEAADGRFNGQESVSRQDMAVILYTFAGSYMNYVVDQSADLSTFSDVESIAESAETAVSWAVANGLLKGIKCTSRVRQDEKRFKWVTVTKLNPTANLSYIDLVGMLKTFTSIQWAEKKEDLNLTILYTNDVHTYINKSLSYATISAIKKEYEDTGENVLLVDAGDHIQGTAYGSLDSGKTIIDLMNAADYDLATLGNHEFDYGMNRTMEVIEEADFPYVSCNFYSLERKENVLDSYEMFDIDGNKVAFVGITTPESFTKSTPAYFMNEDRTEYIYDILGGEDGQLLYDTVQTAIDEAHAEGADYVIALGHLGIDPSSKPWTSEEVIANTTGLDAFIDGHSHSTIPMKEVEDEEGNPVVLTQTGYYFSGIGKMTINGSDITAELITEYEGEGDAAVEAIQNQWIENVDTQLGRKIAFSEINFTVNNPEDPSDRIIREMETNLGDLNADAYYYYFNEVEELGCDVAFMNGGGIRANVDAGDWTYKTCKTVNPFGNVICLLEVSGQQILDALEFGARYSGGDEDCGGFLHVAGMTYDINTDIENTVQVDEKGVWIGGPTGEYRVQNVKIYDKKSGEYVPLDVNKNYKVGGINYTLRNSGDGFAMFNDATLVKDYCGEDYLIFAKYLENFGGSDADGCPVISTANSPLSSYENYLLNYENPYGAGRITRQFAMAAEKISADEIPAEENSPAEMIENEAVADEAA
ncbi:MAG: bifunctional metallophosphatase/5'-nucleotidase [Lachnospiraceae bacterium]|nr:bifunctional metallophosphatase/5'-nucleotidase [Lachnospiraceae bacterium]